MSPEEYDGASRLFHKIALSGRATPELFFDIEKTMHGGDLADASEGAHVFVSGLARSGTTLLMRMLHDTSAFASLTYRDMPLVMAPNLWKKIGGAFQKTMTRRERAHGDGLEVDYDSPEALEEVFWRTFCGQDYIHADALRPMTADDEVIEEFRLYVALILKRYEKARYLSKNNNSILRLPSIVAALPQATVLVPFRDPLSQAVSLQRQHQRFTKTHSENAFSRHYMSWLAHHEFGGDQRRFVFDEAQDKDYGDPDNLSYWLDLWIDAYAYLSKQADGLGRNIMFFSYEQLTDAPEHVRAQLFERLDLKSDAPLEVRDRPIDNHDHPALSRLDEARALYAEMTERAQLP